MEKYGKNRYPWAMTNDQWAMLDGPVSVLCHRHRLPDFGHPLAGIPVKIRGSAGEKERKWRELT